jgi:hypothetical protein
MLATQTPVLEAIKHVKAQRGTSGLWSGLGLGVRGRCVATEYEPSIEQLTIYMRAFAILSHE